MKKLQGELAEHTCRVVVLSKVLSQPRCRSPGKSPSKSPGRARSPLSKGLEGVSRRFSGAESPGPGEPGASCSADSASCRAETEDAPSGVQLTTSLEPSHVRSAV